MYRVLEMVRRRRSHRRRKTRKHKINWNKIRWGSLTEWLLRHRTQIVRRYGEQPFTKRGTINNRLLRRMKNDPEFLKEVSGTHYKDIEEKINFKLNVLNHKKKKKHRRNR